MASVQGVLSKAVKSIEGRSPKIKGAFSSVGKYTKISAQKFDNAAKSLGESAKAMFEGGQKLKLKSANNAAKNATKTISDISAKASTTAKIEQIGTELPEGVPKHLYHMTSEANYQKMLKDGVMHGSSWEQQAIEIAKEIGEPVNGMGGCYMVSKNNFVNKWMGGKNEELFGNLDIGEMLLQQTRATTGLPKELIKETNPTNTMVAIQIPTKALEQSKLRFRPYFEAVMESFEEMGKSSSLCTEGLPLSELSKYIDKGPVEYVYQGKIPVNLFSGIKISQADLPYKEIVKNLFG